MSYKPESRQAGETTTSDRLIPLSLVSVVSDDTTLTAESEEELKSLSMRVKEERRVRVSLKIKKKKKINVRSWHPAPLLHGKYKGERRK